MKKLILIAVLAFVAMSAHSQDVIIKKNGTDVKAKVLDITQTEIRYKRYDNLNGPSITIDKAGVLLITYQNGTIDVFNEVSDQGVYSEAEVMPMASFNVNEYLQKYLQYPPKAKKNGIAGQVRVRFVVSETGKIENVVALTDHGYGLEEEVIRLVRNMPDFTPGYRNGKPVRVYFTMPVSFRLTE